MKDFVGYGLEALPFEARETFNALYESAMLRGDLDAAQGLEQLLGSLGRAESKRESDRTTDARRRRTVGARVPVDFYERVARCAGARGVSLYRFVVDALERECGDEI